MCDMIYLNQGEIEIGTAAQLRELVGPTILPPPNPKSKRAVHDDEKCCLCNTDVEGILTAAGYSFWVEHGMYYYAHKDED